MKTLAEATLTILNQFWQGQQSWDRLEKKYLYCQRLERSLQRSLPTISLSVEANRDLVLAKLAELEQTDPTVRQIMLTLLEDESMSHTQGRTEARTRDQHPQQTIIISGDSPSVANITGNVTGGIGFGSSGLHNSHDAAPKKIRASVFISYRRSASASFVARLYEYLVERVDGRVFYDLETMGSGRFSQKILDEIAACSVFLSVISTGTLDRIHQDDDWVRREIVEALRLRKTIILVLEDNVSFPDKEDLPTDVQELLTWNGIRIYHQTFKGSVQKLIDMMR